MKRYLLTGFVGLSLLLAACGGGVSGGGGSGGGGSGGGGGTPSPSITLTVEDPAGRFAAAAYQVGSGPWQKLDMSGSSTKTATFSLEGQSKYGVAVRCIVPEDTNVSLAIIQATNSELANPKIVCSSPPSPTPSMVLFTVIVDIDSSLLAQGDRVCINDVICQQVQEDTTRYFITAYLEPGSNRDLLITLKDGSDWVKVAKVQKGVDVKDRGNTTVSLGPRDRLDEVPFYVRNAPTGYKTDAKVFYWSANNTAFSPLNASLTSYWSANNLNASPTSYRPVSEFSDSDGDRYVAMASAMPTNESDKATNAELLELLSTTQLFSSGSPSLSLPAPWSPKSLTIGQNPHPSVSGLSRTDDDLRAYLISFFQLYDSSQTSRLFHTTVLSKGWLDGRTSYSVPDLSNLLGYAAPSNESQGLLFVIALLSNKDVPFLLTDLADPATLRAGDYLKTATVLTDYTVGGGQITLP